jgi:hypothetical protein
MTAIIHNFFQRKLPNRWILFSIDLRESLRTVRISKGRNPGLRHFTCPTNDSCLESFNEPSFGVHRCGEFCGIIV